MKNRRWFPYQAPASLFLALFLCLQGCGSETLYYQTESSPEESVSSSGEETETEEVPAEPERPEIIWVYVCGAVRDPGVYGLPAGSRVFEALAAAGGLTEEAEERSLNQAALLTDGEQITVCTREEIEAQGGIQAAAPGGSEGSSGSGRVNLNTAGKEELMTLTGIGEARAAAILAYREQNGPFTSIEEIMNIDGIKEKSFEKIKDNIEV